MSKASKRQRQESRELGVKLARALREHAELARKDGLDPDEVALAAADYLNKWARSSPDELIDPTRTDPGDRLN